MQPPQGALTSAAGYHNIFAKEKMRMAKKGDWVRIHSIVLKADERTAKLPEDTQSAIFNSGQRVICRRNRQKSVTKYL